MRRQPAIVAAIVFGSLTLAACGGGGSDGKTTTVTQTQSSTTSSSTSSTTTSDTSTTSTSSSTSEPAAGGDQKLTPPDTELKLGDSAILYEQVGDESDDYYAYATLKVTVTTIDKGDPDAFKKFKNAKDFKGYTPYYIRATTEILSLDAKKDVNDNLSPTFNGLLKGGAEAGSVIAFSGFGDVCESDIADEKKVGATSETCTVALAPEGAAVTGVKWAGDSDSEKNPYEDAPVTWIE